MFTQTQQKELLTSKIKELFEENRLAALVHEEMIASNLTGADASVQEYMWRYFQSENASDARRGLSRSIFQSISKCEGSLVQKMAAVIDKIVMKLADEKFAYRVTIRIIERAAEELNLQHQLEEEIKRMSRAPVAKMKAAR